MHGLIQEVPLLISDVLAHAASYHARTPIISRQRDGSFHHTSWAGLDRRVRMLSGALLGAGVRPGDRVATLAWNNHRHLEAYFAIAAIGAICHPINTRLFPDQVAYIASHAEDVALLYDLEYASLAQTVAQACKPMLAQIAMCSADELPNNRSDEVIAYEDFIETAEPLSRYPSFDERTAASLCYTSGTTGNPKGVLSSHRALVLHSMTTRTSDILDLRPTSRACIVVPFFHAHAAWGLPFACGMAGSAVILPGLPVDGSSLAFTINAHRATVATGVPTIWQGLVDHLAFSDQTVPTLKRVVIAGSAPAPALLTALADPHGVEVCHAWGMTETGPFGTSGAPLSGASPDPIERNAKQGHGMFGVQMRISNDQSSHCVWGEEHVGRLQVRGPFIISAYFKQEGAAPVDPDGWFDTGDVASIDERGCLKIVDRDKDLVKSGGEWISSIEVENAAQSFAGVKEAALIAIPHDRWGERPLLLVVAAEGVEISPTELRDFLGQRLAKWWLPDRIISVPDLPKTGTGKIMKAVLRKQYADCAMADA